MDANEYPSLGRLAWLNAQLAVQSARTEAIVAGQLDDCERLFRAAADRDWAAVAGVSQALTRKPATAENAALIHASRKVCDALRVDPTGATSVRALAQLLNLCRVQRRSASRGRVVLGSARRAASQRPSDAE